MTITAQPTRADYNGDGVVTTFTVPFRFLDKSHLQVLRTVVATNVSTVLTLDSVGADGYSVSGAGQPDGGEVTVVTAPLGAPNEERLSILLNMPFTQLIDYIANDSFPAESHERGLDERTLENRQLKEVTDRAIVLPPQTTGVSTQLPGPQALYLLRWNAAENALENAQPPAIATVADGAVVDATVSPIAGIQTTKLAYTPPSTVVAGDLKTFLDSLWITGATVDPANKGTDLVAFPDPLTANVAYLKTTSDIINGLEVSVDRFIEKSKIAAIRANTSTVDLSANFQDAFDAFNSTGQGKLYCARGQYTLNSETVLAFNGEVRGDGMGATRFRLAGAAANGFRVAYSGLVHFHDFDIFAGVTKTNGAGILYEGLGGSAGQLCRISNVRALDQYIAFSMANAGYWKIDGCGIFEPVQFGIYVDNTQNYDAGDNLIHGCVIQKTALTSGTAGVQQVASGGTKMSNTKILGFDRGYALIPRSGALSVIDTQLTGNSIEDGNTGVFVQTAVAGTSVGQMTLVGNQMSNKTNGIVLIGAMSGVVVGSNQIAVNFPSHIGIYLDSMNGSPSQVITHDNQLSGNSSAGSIGIYGGNLANTKHTDNQISGCATPYSTVANAMVRGFELPFSLLPASGNGSYGYVSDGTVASPVAGGGTGCFAKRLNGVWVGN